MEAHCQITTLVGHYLWGLGSELESVRLNRLVEAGQCHVLVALPSVHTGDRLSQHERHPQKTWCL